MIVLELYHWYVSWKPLTIAAFLDFAYIRTWVEALYNGRASYVRQEFMFYVKRFELKKYKEKLNPTLKSKGFHFVIYQICTFMIS